MYTERMMKLDIAVFVLKTPLEAGPRNHTKETKGSDYFSFVYPFFFISYTIHSLLIASMNITIHCEQSQIAC